MPLEDAIKQKNFESEFQKAYLNILVTASWLSANFTTLLKPYKISLEQYNVLRILRGQYPNPCTLHTIQERMMDRSSNAGRLVDKLLAAELLSRNECPSNRRKVDILITQKGLDLLETVDPLARENADRLNVLSLKECEELNKMLDSLRDAVN
jgi:DNA-binding MarR family transcriptional regulator